MQYAAWSACFDRCAEDVRVQALVIPELKLIDVEMEVFLADLMECANDPTLHDGPEAFDGVGMNRSADIFSLGMMNHTVRDARIEFPIAAMIVSRKQADMMRNRFMNELVQSCGIRALNHASNHIALALDGTHHDEFSLSASAPEVSASALPFVFVLGFPAHIGFAHFDIADQLLEFDIAQRHADLAAHEPRGFIGTETHVATDLKRTDALFTRQHQVHDTEPDAEWFIRVLEDRPDENGKAIANTSRRAFVALPVIGLRVWMHIVIVAARTSHAFRPAVLHQIFRAGRVIWKHPLEIYDGHLVNVERVF